MVKVNKHLVSTGIILSLLGSNIIIGNQYIHDNKKFEREIKRQNKIIHQYRDEKMIQIEKLRSNSLEINILHQQLDQVKQERDKIQLQKTSIEKQLASRGEQLHPKAYYEVTAFTSGYESTGKTPSDPDYRITASGTHVKEGRTIACPSSLPFGTKVNIQTVGMRICEDHGAAIKQGKIDLYVENLSKALEFGRKTLLVEILN